MGMHFRHVNPKLISFYTLRSGHGIEYLAPVATQKRWMDMDPLNVLNPGIGGLSTLPKYGK